MRIIDADGHVNDAANQEEIATYMPKKHQASQLFPALDVLGGNALRLYPLAEVSA